MRQGRTIVARTMFVANVHLTREGRHLAPLPDFDFAGATAFGVTDSIGRKIRLAIAGGIV